MVDKRGLGRGLSALIGDVNAPVGDESAGDPSTVPVSTVPIENIEPNRDQPRRDFDAEKLKELAASIQEKGVLQPLLVRQNPSKSNSYQIVAGERRWRAAQMAKVHELPVLLRDYSDDEVLEIAIIENVQRADLNPVEEALGYRQLMDRFGHTQEKLAEALSKSRSHIANLMRLLQLPDDVLDMLRHGQLTTGHARALITADNPSALARQIVSGGLSVRDAEKLGKSGSAKAPARKRSAPAKDADTKALEGDLTAATGMRVSIDHGPTGDGGHVTIRYRTLDQLDDLCRTLSGFEKS